MKLSNPIELLRGGNTGEREPKTNDHDDNRNPLFSRRLFYRTYNKRTDGGIRKVLHCSYTCYYRDVCPVYGRKYCIFKMLRNKKSYYYKTRHLQPYQV